MGQVKFAPAGSPAVKAFLLAGSPCWAARPHPRGIGDPAPRPDRSRSPRQRLLDRRPQRLPRHARARQGLRAPAGAGVGEMAGRGAGPRSCAGGRPVSGGSGGSGGDALIAIDVGTSGARAAAFDTEGHRVLRFGAATRPSPRIRAGPSRTPAPGGAPRSPRSALSSGSSGRAGACGDQPHRAVPLDGCPWTRAGSRSGRASSTATTGHRRGRGNARPLRPEWIHRRNRPSSRGVPRRSPRSCGFRRNRPDEFRATARVLQPRTWWRSR